MEEAEDAKHRLCKWAEHCIFNACFKSQGSRNKPKGAQGPGAQGQKQLTLLEDVVVLTAWEWER